MGFVREVKYFCGKEYLEVNLFEVSDMSQRGKGLRRKKHNPSTKEQKSANKKRAVRKLERLIKTNFHKHDAYYLTLTFSKEYMPKSLKEAEKQMKRFIDRVNKRLKRRTMANAKWIYVVETGKTKKNYHVHMVMNRVMSRNEIEDLWRIGLANAQRLRMDMVDRLADYLLKEAHQPNQKKWHRSRNLKEPTVRKNDFKISHSKLELFGKTADCRGVFEGTYKGYRYIDAESSYNEFTGWHVVAKFKKQAFDAG